MTASDDPRPAPDAAAGPPASTPASQPGGEPGHPDDEAHALAFAQHTRRRRIFFAVTAFGAAFVAIVGALLLFGGQLQTSERARRGAAADELRRAFNTYRTRCQGMWRHVYGVDFLRVHPDVAHGLVQRLRGSALTCEEVGALAERLPRRPEGDAK